MASNTDQDQLISEQSSNEDVIKPASTTLDQLTSSINELKVDVSSRAMNKTFVKEVPELGDELRGAEFSKFPKLPREIRIIIWQLSLTTPQIHIIRDVQNKHSSHSLSKTNLIMQVCQEARDEGLNMKLPYFYLGTRGVIDTPTFKNYFNYEEDTFWIPSTSFLLSSLYCSRCEIELDDGSREPSSIPCKCTHARSHRLGGIAINYDKSRDSKALEPFLLRHNVKKLDIVVSATQNGAELMQLREVAFEVPSVLPYKMFRGSWGDPTRTWDMMAMTTIQFMSCEKLRREIFRHANEENGDPRDLEDGGKFADVSHWILPSMEFVAVGSGSVWKDGFEIEPLRS